MICADRWLRGFEELPVTLGAKILIDCSANARKEWIPEFAWYLPVTRALRNNVFSIFCNMGEHPQGMDEPRHGHSAIIHPDGAFAAAADDAGDQMLVATLDLSQGSRRRGPAQAQPPGLQAVLGPGTANLAGREGEHRAARAVCLAPGGDHDCRRPDGLLPRCDRESRTHGTADRRGRRPSRGRRGLSRNWP